MLLIVVRRCNWLAGSSLRHGHIWSCFGCFVGCLVLGTSTFSGRDECGGVTCACTCPKRRNINIVIQDSCTLSSSVNKCITICTPSIHLVVSPCHPIIPVKRRKLPLISTPAPCLGQLHSLTPSLTTQPDESPSQADHAHPPTPVANEHHNTP